MLRIDGKRIIPAPLIQIAKNYTDTGDGRPLSHLNTITLNGTILPNHGSPNSSGTFWTAATGTPGSQNFASSNDKFGAILNKQEYLKELFKNPGQVFEYAPDDGSATVSGHIRVANLNFEQGQWVDKCNYSIGLEVEILNRVGSSGENYGDFYNYHLTQASDNISITEPDDGSHAVNINHSLSAAGRAFYQASGVLSGGKEPWENARDWCQTQLYSTFSSLIINTTGKVRYNVKSTESIDRWAGTYSISQSYTINANNLNYVHNYDIQKSVTRSQVDDLDQGQLLTENITVNGSVVGLYSSGNSPTGKLAIARDVFYGTIESGISYSAGLSSGHLYTSKSVGESTSNGTLNYSYNYTNYPVGHTYTHVFNVNDSKVSNGLSSANIAGTIKYNTSAGVATGIFLSATGVWNTVKAGIKAQAQAIVGATLCTEPVNLTINFDKSNASVGYSATYNYVTADNPSAANYIDTYEVTLNDGGLTYPVTTISPNGTVSVVGSIVGLSSDGQSDQRYANAVARWAVVKPLLITRATGLILSTGITPRVTQRSEAYNRANGTINYSYTFTTKLIGTAGIANEDITIDISNPRDVYAIQIIPGLTGGPIIQNINTRTEARLSITANFTLDPGVATSVGDTRFNTIISPYVPVTGFVDANTSNLNVYTNNYTRTKSWVYKG